MFIEKKAEVLTTEKTKQKTTYKKFPKFAFTQDLLSGKDDDFFCAFFIKNREEFFSSYYNIISNVSSDYFEFLIFTADIEDYYIDLMSEEEEIKFSKNKSFKKFFKLVKKINIKANKHNIHRIFMYQ